MRVEFAEELKPVLEEHGSDLQVQGMFSPENEIVGRYLNRPYGNAYDFDQAERLADVF